MRNALVVAAVLVVGACSRSGAPAPQPAAPSGTRVLATFVADVDVATRTMTFRTPSGPARKWVVDVPVDQDGTPGTGASDKVELVTESTAIVPGGCSGTDAFEGTVRLRSFFHTAALQNAHVQITGIPSGREACNSTTTPPAGMDASYGLFPYGTVGIASGGADSTTAIWRFKLPDQTRFSFTGRVVAEGTSLQAVVFYATGWTTPAIQYGIAGTWTTPPGLLMSESACAGWAKKTIDLGTATAFDAVFTDTHGNWDHATGGGNYALTPGLQTVKNGAVTPGAADPCGGAPTPHAAVVYYATTTRGWSSVDLHYGVNGTWTTPPGVAMDETACAGWKKKSIDVGSATSFQATFNDGNGSWDNNGGNNYTLALGVSAVKDGAVTTADPCVSDTTPPSVPQNLTAVASGTSIALTWTASTDTGSGVAGYEITRAGGGTTATLTASTNAYSDSGLSPLTTYTYTVKARDVAGNASGPSGSASATTGPATANQATVYYATTGKSWPAFYIHYGIAGVWTTVPGVVMDEPACTGWVKKTVDLGSASTFAVAFNSGTGTWDSNGGLNYTVGLGITRVSGGVATGNSSSPCAADTTPPSVPQNLSAVASGTTVALSWSASTDAESGVAGYVITRTGGTAGAATLNASGTAYSDTNLEPLTTYSYTVKARDGAGNASGDSGAAQATTGPASLNQAEVYYYTTTKGWSAVDIHYGINNVWTTPPGVAMNETACAGWAKKTVDLGAATTFAVTFNNGAGAWDSNGGNNYALGIGRTTVKDGTVTASAIDPCVPDTLPPSTPQHVAATARNLSITVTWDASTDDRGVTGYQLTRTGGSQGTTLLTAGTNFYTDSSLDPTTSYSYTVVAYDAAGNTSGVSGSASATTGTAPPAPPPGAPLGTDAREDSIYFVLTARFYDGDPSNNRGGSQHVKSGNAANNDPMFRGDFAGLIQKLDYIKALGFSAIWITPVVLNRSDYDYHGYHGWDFYRVDPRLESAGATYQDLINAAHAKGIKIIQDIVINHSCRWGAKGLWTTKVYGVRDGQWSWFYDAPQPGFEYDGLTVEPVSGKAYYNGDLWSTPEPAGNTCRSWGVPNGYYSPEGYKIYNCQWPNPTSGMFPPAYYHQCWIGNWEGEDSRSCWLADDLADFNTENAAVQKYLIDAYDRFIDMGVDGFRIDTAVHVPRVTWNRRFLPAFQQHAVAKFGSAGQNFYMFGEVGAFVNDKWNRGSVNHSAQFFTWKERKTYVDDDVQASLDQYNYEEQLGTGSQPTSTNAFLSGNSYHAPDHSQFSGMNIIDMRMHMNFGDAGNAFWNGKDSDDSTNDATYNVVYVDSHDYGPNKSSTAYAGGTDAWAENMSLMWTFRGIPTIFQGSEIEFQAGKQIDCGPSCPLATTRRAYFGDHLEGTVTASDFGVTGSASGAVATTLQYPLAKHLQRLNMIRRRIPALQKGQYSTEGVSGGIAYKRRYTDGQVDSFALVTISAGATFSGIPNGTYTDVITGDVKNVTGGSLTASVSGKGNMRIYVLNGPGKIGSDGPYLKP